MSSAQYLLRPLLAVAASACGDQLAVQQSDGAGTGAAVDASPDAATDAATGGQWGRLAGPGREGLPMVATLFFAGEARDGSARYEFPAASNMELYTESPVDERQLRWSSQPSTRLLVLDQMVAAGVNVVYLSYWGARGSDVWSRFAPMQSSTYAHDEVLSAIGQRPLQIVPFIESHSDWSFRADFPGTPSAPSPGLVAQAIDLVDRILVHPADPGWPDRWATVYGPDGRPRHAIAIIHASSDALIDDQAFADGLDAAAAAVEEATGVQVGFLLDALPPGSFAPGTSFPAPASSAEPMSRSASVLGISCFLPEIWVGFGEDAGDTLRLTWKREFTAAWAASGVPTLADVSPGYDASIVFPGSVRYGHTPEWREELRRIVADHGADGLVLNSWNGYTEAMAMVPTVERGDAAARWAAELAAIVTPR